MSDTTYEEAVEQGYRGEVFDPHPNSDYTAPKVTGVDFSDVFETAAAAAEPAAEKAPPATRSAGAGAKK
jgi:hypothetical protein